MNNFFKSLFGKIVIGGVVLLVFILGILWFGGKPQQPVQAVSTTKVMKIPKSIPIAKQDIKKSSADITREKAAPPKTVEEKIQEQYEKSLGSGPANKSDEEDSPDPITSSDQPDKEVAQGTDYQTETSNIAEEIKEESGAPVQKQVLQTETAYQAGIQKEQAGFLEENKPQSEKVEKKHIKTLKDEAIAKKLLLSETSRKRILRDIKFTENNSELTLKILANSPIVDYKYFILSNPPRLVVDLLGKWRDPDFRGKKVENSLIDRVRLWNHKNKLRIVHDLKSNKSLKPVFTLSPEGIYLTLKTK